MRTLNRLVALLFALALLLGGILVAIEILIAGLGRGPWIIPYDSWYETLRFSAWDDIGVRQAAGILCFVGLVLIILQLVRRRPLGVPIEGWDERVKPSVNRSSLEKSLARAASSVDGVSGAKSRVSKTGALVMARTNRSDPTGLREAVTARAQQRLLDVGASRPLKVKLAAGRETQT
jgi:Family of unknown function (DUF6286)